MPKGLRWTDDELAAYNKRQKTQVADVSSRATPKENKYHAKRVEIDGYSFDSKKEAARYGELKLMQASKIIVGLIVHPAFEISYRNQFICSVELDFQYYSDELKQQVFEDVKGKDNPLSKLKRKLVEAFYKVKVELI